jgi:dihydroflavonol-4-reductase
MSTILVTGATGFLGFHVVRRLNERGVRPRVLELRDSDRRPLAELDVDVVEGHLEDQSALDTACTGADTLLHLAFRVAVGGGAKTEEEMRRINIVGSERLLRSAAANGVRTAVVSSSALAVGINREPEPLDESADWTQHPYEIPYVIVRREAERAALAMAAPEFTVVAVCPSFTMGPRDPVGAPANKLLKTIAAGKMRLKVPVGFGCLDVRDFADGVLLAAERGRSGQRYLLSGENVTAEQFLGLAATAAGVRPPRLQPPRPLLTAVVTVIGLVSKLRKKEPPITPGVLQLIGRNAWYDTTRARSELGWTSRPLQQTVEETIAWLRQDGLAASRPAKGSNR